MADKVLVTGGAGFIGSHICEELLGAGYEVAVLDNLSSGDRSQVPVGARFFEADITDDVDDVFEDFRPEIVVHQAAQVSVAVSMDDPEMDARVNLLGSIRLLEIACRHNVKKVLYASSAASYGEQDEQPMHEDMRPRPVSCYGVSKHTVEHYLRTAGKSWGLEWAALRYSNVYGPRQDPHGEAGVIAIFAGLLLQGKRPTIFGGGELTRDYIFVKDVARANLAVLEADLAGHPDPIFNASTTVPTSTNRIFEILSATLNKSVEPIEAPWRPGDVRDSILDNRKLRELTGWEPTVSLDEGLKLTAEFFLGETAKLTS